MTAEVHLWPVSCRPVSAIRRASGHVSSVSAVCSGSRPAPPAAAERPSRRPVASTVTRNRRSRRAVPDAVRRLSPAHTHTDTPRAALSAAAGDCRSPLRAACRSPPPRPSVMPLGCGRRPCRIPIAAAAQMPSARQRQAPGWRRLPLPAAGRWCRPDDWPQKADKWRRGPGGRRAR